MVCFLLVMLGLAPAVSRAQHPTDLSGNQRYTMFPVAVDATTGLPVVSASSGAPDPNTPVEASYACPSVTLTACGASVDNTQTVHTDLGDFVQANVVLGGIVNSGVCDTTPGGVGIIDHIQVLVDGQTYPYDGGPTGNIPVTVQKDATGHGAGSSLYRPYAYQGTFSVSLPMGLAPGWHVVSVVATDPIQNFTGGTVCDLHIGGEFSDSSVMTYHAEVQQEPPALPAVYQPVVLCVLAPPAAIRREGFRVSLDASPEDQARGAATTAVPVVKLGNSYYVEDLQTKKPLVALILAGGNSTLSSGAAPMEQESASMAAGNAMTPDAAASGGSAHFLSMSSNATLAGNAGQFGRGLVVGAWGGVTGVFQGAWSLVKDWKSWWRLTPAGMMFSQEMYYSDKQNRIQAWVQYKQVGALYEELHDMSVAAFQNDFSIANDIVAKEGKSVYMKGMCKRWQAILWAYATVLQDVMSDLKRDTPFIAGTATGRVVFEILLFVGLKGAGRAAEAGGEASRLARGAAEAAEAANEMGAVGKIGALRELENILDEAGLKTAAAKCGQVINVLGCFVAGTTVQMADGTYRAIETIRIGDRVLSRNPAAGKLEARRVVRTSVRHVHSVLRLQFADSRGHRMTITTTTEHPFFVKGRGFVRAGSLGIGTQIVTRAGPCATITATRIMTRVAGYTVYNLTVEADHTYFVGKLAGGVWVHNGLLCGPGLEGLVNELAKILGAKYASLAEGDCDIVADRVADAMAPFKQVLGAKTIEILDMRYPHRIMQMMTADGRVISTLRGTTEPYHTVVAVDGMIYDRLTFEKFGMRVGGLPIGAYRKLIMAGENMIFTVVKTY